MRESHGNASDRNANNNQATLIDHFGKKQFCKHLHGTEPDVPCSSLTRHTYIPQARIQIWSPTRDSTPLSLVILAQRYTKKKRGGNATEGKKGNVEGYTSLQTRHNGTRTMRRRSDKGVREGRATGCEKVERRVRTLRTLAIRDDVLQSMNVFDEA